MDILDNIDDLLVSWGMSAQAAEEADQFVAFALVLIIAFTADAICRKILLRAVAHIVRKTKATWDDIVFDHKVMVHLSRMVAPVIISLLTPMALADTSSSALSIILRACHVYVAVSIINFFNAFLKAVYSVYTSTEKFKDRPMKGLLQTLQVALWIVGGITILGILIDKSPLNLLAGLGASAAILMLVFKDSIMGLVSGVQLSANDMLKVGDWISMPKQGADGTVIEVTLNTVKVRNWDNTITTIPPYLLVSDSFQNWRGMRESGGRRVKRSIFIDLNSIRFCTSGMLERYRRIDLLKEHIDRTEQALLDYKQEHGIDGETTVNNRRPTNLGIFRAYITAYLKSLPEVNTDLHCMVRHLQPTEHGLPMELYFYSRQKDWIPYEQIQADIFDHILAVVPEFDLRLFQSPSGSDIQLWNQTASCPNK